MKKGVLVAGVGGLALAAIFLPVACVTCICYILGVSFGKSLAVGVLYGIMNLV